MFLRVVEDMEVQDVVVFVCRFGARFGILHFGSWFSV